MSKTKQIRDKRNNRILANITSSLGSDFQPLPKSNRQFVVLNRIKDAGVQATIWKQAVERTVGQRWVGSPKAIEAVMAELQAGNSLPNEDVANNVYIPVPTLEMENLIHRLKVLESWVDYDPDKGASEITYKEGIAMLELKELKIKRITKRLLTIAGKLSQGKESGDLETYAGGF